MAGWGTFLASVAGPVTKKALTAIGVGTLTIVGVQAAVDKAIGAVKASMGGLSGVVADLVAMAGMFTAVGIIAGGITAAASIMVMQRLAKLT